MSFFIVGVVGFEPTTPCSQSRCANRTALYPDYKKIALLAILNVAERGGFEPPVPLRVRQFSKLLVSATHPPLRTEFYRFLKRSANIALPLVH